MVSQYPAKRATAFTAVFPILDADGDLVTGAAGLDSEVSKDLGTFTDCTNEAVEIATASGMYYLTLTATEMTADIVSIIVKTSTSGAKTTALVFYTAANLMDDIKTDTAAIKAKTDLIGATVALEASGNLAAVKAKTDLIPADITTQLDTNVPAIKAKTDIIGASVALESGGNLAAIAGKLPTNKIMGSSVVTDKDDEIDAIKAKTDLIGASVALESGGNLATVLAESQSHPTLAEIEATTVLAKVTTVTTAHATTDGKIDVIDGIVDTMLTHTTALKKIGVNKWAIIDTSFIIYDDNKTTPLYTFTLDSATAPTVRTPT